MPQHTELVGDSKSRRSDCDSNVVHVASVTVKAAAEQALSTVMKLSSAN